VNYHRVARDADYILSTRTRICIGLFVQQAAGLNRVLTSARKMSVKVDDRSSFDDVLRTGHLLLQRKRTPREFRPLAVRQ
jgi:hypothetical protein